MRTGKLKARQVATAAPGKYEDGAGLRLVVSQSGSRRWVFRFMLNRRSREMGLGGYPDVSLAEVRGKADEHRKQVKAGIDPIEARAEAQATTEKTLTFTSCAAQYILAHRNGWENTKHAHQWVRTLKTYARPKIGAKPVDTIGTEEVLNILELIWHTKTETAKRVQGRLENILDYAAAHGYRDQTNPARWRGHLDKLLPKPSRVKRFSHHPAMPHTEVPAFMLELAGNGSVAALALRFLTLTATRTSEVLHAQWHEIDLETAVWTIPAERMKARREHRVPLADAAMSILEALPCIKDNPYPLPRRLSRPPLVQQGIAAIDAPHGLWGERRPGRLRAARLSFQLPRLVRGGLQFPAGRGGDGPGPRHRKQGGGRLPAWRPVRQASPDDVGVGGPMCPPSARGKLWFLKEPRKHDGGVQYPPEFLLKSLFYKDISMLLP